MTRFDTNVTKPIRTTGHAAHVIACLALFVGSGCGGRVNADAVGEEPAGVGGASVAANGGAGNAPLGGSAGSVAPIGGAAAVSLGGTSLAPIGGATAVAIGGATVAVSGGGTTATNATSGGVASVPPLSVTGGASGGLVVEPAGAGGVPSMCGATRTGMVIANNTPCSASDPQQCFKQCGPTNNGTKLVNCVYGAYAQDVICQFDPTADYSCFRIPEVLSAECPLDLAPRLGDPCNVTPCTPCHLDGAYRNQSQGVLVPGYCICRPADLEGRRRWGCGQALVSWPCPGNPGC